MSKNKKVKILLVIILVLIIIAVIIAAIFVQRYYATTKECTNCGGTGKVTGACEGRQQCWLCEGKCTRVLCNEVGLIHEHKYKSKELKNCPNCNGFKWTNVYMCSNCEYMTYYCNSCGELSETECFGSMTICAVCDNTGYVDCEHNVTDKHIGQLTCEICEGKKRIPADMETCNHNIVVDEGKEATCVDEGKTEGSHCSICNATITKQETISTTEHTIEDWEEIDNNVHRGTCKECENTIDEEHEYEDGKCIKCKTQDPSTSENIIPNTGIEQLIIMILNILGLASVGAIIVRKYKDI